MFFLFSFERSTRFLTPKNLVMQFYQDNCLFLCPVREVQFLFDQGVLHA